MTDKKNLFRIDTSKIANPLLRVGAGLSRPLIEHTLCFPQLNRIYPSSGSKSICALRKVWRATPARPTEAIW